MITSKPTFMIGDVPIYGDLILAPMDGITDLPFRGICRQLGSALSVTEFINTLDVLEDNPHYRARLAFEPSHRPLALQLLGDQPERLLQTALQLIPEVQPDILDINLGCQSKNVTTRGAGAALMQTPEKIGQIFSMLTGRIDLPITGKIRLGWDWDSLNYLEVAKIIQDHGGSMVAIHGRTRKQAYNGDAHWEPIREVKDALQIPVIGNGDVRTVADIKAIKCLTDCDGVMIGRAAVGNPWIFSRMDREEVPLPEVRKVVHLHLEKMLDFYGERGLIQFRKFLKAYLAPYHLPEELILTLLTSKNPNNVKITLGEIWQWLT